jgi:DNA-binding NarL/FixJ family response regulator
MNGNLPLQGQHVLVVEDQYLLAREVCEWLEEAGAEVIGPAPNSKQACELLEREAVDSAVVDINLGHGPTYDVACLLNQLDVPFLFATGYDQAAIPAEFQDKPRLEKPFKGTDLVKAMQGLDKPD